MFQGSFAIKIRDNWDLAYYRVPYPRSSCLSFPLKSFDFYFVKLLALILSLLRCISSSLCFFFAVSLLRWTVEPLYKDKNIHG